MAIIIDNTEGKYNNSLEDEKKPDYLSDESWQFVLGTEKILTEYIPKPQEQNDEYIRYRKAAEYFFSDIIISRLILTMKDNRDEYITNHEDSVGAVNSVVSNIGLEPDVKDKLTNRLKEITVEDIKQIVPFYKKFNDDEPNGEYEIFTDRINDVINENEPASNASAYLDTKRDGEI